MHWSYCDIASLSAQQLQAAYEKLSVSRKEHIDRFRRPEDRNRSLAGQILAETLLQEHYGIRDSLERITSGQPFFPHCDVHVSISHCDQLVACALSREPVGIDIERIRPINLKMCRHVCREEEKAYLLSGKEYEEEVCEDPEILQRFFEIWTAKEAYFKKCGTGITDLRSVNILPLPRQIHRIGDYMLQLL